MVLLALQFKVNALIFGCIIQDTPASVVQWLEFLAADPEVPGSIPSATRFSE
jgi:hypothetical protein